MNCFACGKPLTTGPKIDLSFRDFDSLSLNGMTLTYHAHCVPVSTTGRDIPLVPRIEEGADDLVAVEQWGDWLAICREHGTVGIKDVEDDAHLAAAYHISRVHSGLA